MIAIPSLSRGAPRGLRGAGGSWEAELQGLGRVCLNLPLPVHPPTPHHSSTRWPEGWLSEGSVEGGGGACNSQVTKQDHVREPRQTPRVTAARCSSARAAGWRRGAAAAAGGGSGGGGDTRVLMGGVRCWHTWHYTAGKWRALADQWQRRRDLATPRAAAAPMSGPGGAVPCVAGRGPNTC